MHLGLPHTEPLNWQRAIENPIQKYLPPIPGIPQWDIPLSPLGMQLPNNILERYLQEDRFGYRPPTPFLGGGMDMLPVNPVNNADPGTMFPVNQLPNQATGISPRLSDREPILEGNNPATGFGFPTRYIYPDKTTGTVPRPSGITGIRPRRSDREPILEGNNPIVNTGLPTGHMGPLPPRAAPFQGSLMEGNNPPVPAPGPEGVGGFAHFMRTRGTPLSNDQLVNAQIALGLGLGLR